MIHPNHPKHPKHPNHPLHSPVCTCGSASVWWLVIKTTFSPFPRISLMRCTFSKPWPIWSRWRWAHGFLDGWEGEGRGWKRQSDYMFTIDYTINVFWSCLNTTYVWMFLQILPVYYAWNWSSRRIFSGFSWIIWGGCWEPHRFWFLQSSPVGG